MSVYFTIELMKPNISSPFIIHLYVIKFLKFWNQL